MEFELKYDQILSEALGLTTQMEEIMKQIISVVAKWRIHAHAIGILKKEQEMMQPAFNF